MPVPSAAGGVVFAVAPAAVVHGLGAVQLPGPATPAGCPGPGPRGRPAGQVSLAAGYPDAKTI